MSHISVHTVTESRIWTMTKSTKLLPPCWYPAIVQNPSCCLELASDFLSRLMWFQGPNCAVYLISVLIISSVNWLIVWAITCQKIPQSPRWLFRCLVLSKEQPKTQRSLFLSYIKLKGSQSSPLEKPGSLNVKLPEQLIDYQNISRGICCLTVSSKESIINPLFMKF